MAYHGYSQYVARRAGAGAVSLPRTREENLERFRFTEGFRLDFHPEVFNLFNRTVFGTGSANLNSDTFGVATNEVSDPRQMQVGLKICR